MIGATIGLVSAIGTLVKIYDGINTFTGNKSTEYQDMLKNLKMSEVDISLMNSNGSMVSFINNYIVTPVIVVSKDSYARNDIDDVLEHAVDVYTAFYLQVFKILSNVHNLKAEHIIRLLKDKVDMEGYNYNPAVWDLDGLDGFNIKTANDLEASTVDIKRKVELDKDDSMPTKTLIRQMNLVINVDHTVDFKDDNKILKDDSINTKLSINIPLIIKAKVYVKDADTIYDSVAHLGENNRFGKRLLQHKLGIISLLDFLLANDLVKKYKENKLNKDNFSSTLNSGAIANVGINNILDKKLGLNKNVISYILTDDETDLLSKKAGYKLNKFKEREQLLNVLLGFNLISINEDRNRISEYIQGIEGYSTSNIKRLVKGNNNKDQQALELLATHLMTNRPF